MDHENKILLALKIFLIHKIKTFDMKSKKKLLNTRIQLANISYRFSLLITYNNFQEHAVRRL